MRSKFGALADLLLDANELWRVTRYVMVMVTVMSLALIYQAGGFTIPIAAAHPASTYSCGHGNQGGPGHCYAYMDWLTRCASLFD